MQLKMFNKYSTMEPWKQLNLQSFKNMKASHTYQSKATRQSYFIPNWQNLFKLCSKPAPISTQSDLFARKFQSCLLRETITFHRVWFLTPPRRSKPAKGAKLSTFLPLNVATNFLRPSSSPTRWLSDFGKSAIFLYPSSAKCKW